MLSAHPAEIAHPVVAGPFGQWLSQFRASLRGDGGTDVPCGECVGCCVSSYFIPIRPADSQARTRIPATHLMRASGSPPGQLVMGYLENGMCPMLSAGQCTIYEDRPQTCRDYDCRIFAAAGIDAGGPDKHVINQRVRHWRFTYSTEEDRRAHGAVLEAASFIRSKGNSFPGGRAPTAPTGIAVLAIKAYAVFLDPGVQGRSDEQTAVAIIEASRAFDAS